MFDPLSTNAGSLRSMLAKVRAVGMDTMCFRIPRDAAQSDVNMHCAIVRQVTSAGLKVAVVGVTEGSDVIHLTSAGCSQLGGPIFGGPFSELPKPYSVAVSSFEEAGRPARLPEFYRGYAAVIFKGFDERIQRIALLPERGDDGHTIFLGKTNAVLPRLLINGQLAAGLALAILGGTFEIAFDNFPARKCLFWCHLVQKWHFMLCRLVAPIARRESDAKRSVAMD